MYENASDLFIEIEIPVVSLVLADFSQIATLDGDVLCHCSKDDL